MQLGTQAAHVRMNIHATSACTQERGEVYVQGLHMLLRPLAPRPADELVDEDGGGSDDKVARMDGWMLDDSLPNSFSLTHHLALVPE